jgi:hypothetical protein
LRLVLEALLDIFYESCADSPCFGQLVDGNVGSLAVSLLFLFYFCVH